MGQLCFFVIIVLTIIQLCLIVLIVLTSLNKYQYLNMERNLSSWLVPLLLIVGCIALTVNIFQVKKINKSLVENVKEAQADLQVASDNSENCKKQLDTKTAEITGKDQQVATLTGN